MTNIVIGKNSLIGTEMQSRFSGPDWLFLSHDKALENLGWVNSATCVINFALSPALRTRAYSPAEDIDLKLAELIRDTQSRFIMMSSRLVYGDGDNLRETNPPKPATDYARNKLQTETALTTILQNRLTILRGANVFGHEYGRKSFFGMALGKLKNQGQIVFDMNPAVERDFIAVWHVADTIARIAAAPHPGIFNLGSGYGTPCRDIAAWLIEGYGTGEIITTSDAPRDAFFLDMSKSKATFGLPDITPAMIREDCRACGAALRSLP